MRDIFKDAVKTYCRIENIVRKTRFSEHDGLVTISIKNTSDEGLDTDCFKVINFIMNIIGRERTKFLQNPFLYPDSERVDKVNITFDSKDYREMIKSAFGEDTY